MNNNPRG